MSCVSCGHEQSSGKFCGNCGREMKLSEDVTAQIQHAASAPPPLQEHVQQQHQAATVSSAPNPAIEKAKATSKSYWNYFKQYIKSPSKSLQAGKKEVKNGMISIILFSVLFGLMPYLIYRTVFGGFGDYGPTFFGAFFQTFMITAAVIFLVITCLFLSNKLFGRQDSYQSTIAIFGAHILLPVIFLVAAVLTTLMNMYTLSSILILLSFITVIGFIPLHIMSSLLTTKSRTADPLYGYFTYVVMISIVLTVFILSIAESSFWEIVSMSLY